MKMTKRYGNKWTINEILALQREYELLEWTVDQIAEKHDRTVLAIISKLESEGFIDSWVNARGYYDSEFLNAYYNDESVDDCGQDEDDYDDEDYNEDDEDYNEDYEDDDEVDYENVGQNEQLENNVNQLTHRVWSLETSVSEIGSIVKQIFSIFSTKSKEQGTTENL